MIIDFNDPTSSEIVKRFFYLEMEVENLPSSHDRSRLMQRLDDLRSAVEQSSEIEPAPPVIGARAYR